MSLPRSIAACLNAVARGKGLARVAAAALALCVAGLAAPAATAKPRFEPVTWTAGDPYFTVAGKRQPVALRNITSYRIEDLNAILDDAGRSGTKLVRVHLTHGFGFGITPAGAIDPAWLQVWDSVFARARRNNVSVIPVFGVWADWNDGFPDIGFANWQNNPLNAANGGPAQSPAELMQADSVTQKLWLGWMKALVSHWQRRDNIAAWESFSELNFATGASEEAGAAFAAAASARIRSADARDRPVMASLAPFADWPLLNDSDAVDIVQVHTYQHDLALWGLVDVLTARGRFGKPVMLAESGLSAAPPDLPGTPSTEPTAPLAVRQALWALALSGSMTFRSLWWEDGYAIYHPTVGLPFVQSNFGVEQPVVKFLSRLPASFAGFQFKEVSSSEAVVGIALGDGNAMAGWLRDAACAAPVFQCDAVRSGEKVTVPVDPEIARWVVDFFETSSGRLLSTQPVTGGAGGMAITVPDFSGDIAFRLCRDTPRNLRECRR